MSVRKRQERTEQGKLLPTASDNHNDEDKHEASDLRGDWGNIAILFFLYLLQGIPIGLASAIPMLLQNRGASYKQQVCHVGQCDFAPYSDKISVSYLSNHSYYSSHNDLITVRQLIVGCCRKIY